jgi:hypothetical protein
MMLMPSIKLRVARSHSAKMSTPLVGSASMAFASSGRFFMSLPEAFSRKILLHPSRAQGGDLAIEILIDAAHPRIADSHRFCPQRFATISYPRRR